MKQIVFAAAAFGLSLVAANAADAVVDEVVVVEAPSGWSGLYLGGFAGYGWGSTDVSKQASNDGTGANAPWLIDTDADGWFGGIQVGYDYQMDRWLVGAVADIAWTHINGSGSKGPPGPPAEYTTEFDWIATLRARAGYIPTDNFLIYAHGGVAFADINLNPANDGPWNDSSFSDTETGWVVGFGAEYKVQHNISLFAEYSYMDFGDGSFPAQGGPTPNIDFDNSLSLIKIGFNARFN
ncbi:MAG: porin family protein [Rhizobiaceae bacterium]|nr:porin family protein [Rhizobiaceae bacterium]